MKLDLPHPLAGTVPQVRAPLRLSGTRCRTRGRRRCSASTRRTCLRDRLGIDDAALADLAARGVIGLRAPALASPAHRVPPTNRREGHHPHARVLDRVRDRVARRARRRGAPVSARDPDRQPRHQDVARRGDRARRARSRRGCISRRKARASPRGSRTTRRRRTTSSSKAAASRRSRRSTQGDRYCAVLVGSAAVHAGRDRRDDHAAEARRRAAGFARRVPETYVRDAARRRSTRRAPARSPKTRRARRLGRRPRAVQAARAVAADADRRPRRSQLHVRAPRAARRGAHPADARRVAGDELTGIAPFVHVPEVVRAPLRGAAQREQPDRRISRACRPACSTASAAASSRVLWLARTHWLVWRPPIVAGLVVGGLLALRSLGRRRAPRGSAPDTTRNRRRRSGRSRAASRC